jgi:hypothetical protein
MLYKQAYEITKDLPEDHNCSITFTFDSTCDKHCYNLPSAAVREIAVIPGSGEEHSDMHDIVLWRRGGALKRINEMSSLYQLLHFVLLFSTGQLGWNPKMEPTLHNQTEAPDEDNNAQLFEPGEEPPLEGEVMATRKKQKYISQIEYFVYCLYPHHNESNHIFKAGRLLQEYMVDSWAAAEQSRLTWLEKN